MSDVTHPFIGRYITCLHWFIPVKLQQDAAILTRAQNVVNAVVLAAISGPFYALTYHGLGYDAAAREILFCCLFMFASPFLLKATGSIGLARETFLCAVFFNFSWLTYHLGGVSAPTAPWLITGPVVAMFLGGVVTAVFWLAMSCAVALFVYGLQFYGVSLPVHPVTDMQLLYLLCNIGLFVVVVVFVLLFELTKTQGFIKLEQALGIINELAIRDELTGSHNRRHLLKLIESEKERTSRMGPVFCLCLLDIDFFKRINDRYGHSAGDNVLKKFASTVQMHTRASDSFGRYGGEEFLLMLTDTTPEEAMLLAERVRIGIERIDFAEISSEIVVTVSIGISLFHQGESISQTVARADQALYQAKAGGRNRVVCHDRDVPATANAAIRAMQAKRTLPDVGAEGTMSAKVENEEITSDRHFDPLTGLLSRNIMRDRLNHAMNRALRNRCLIALMVLNVDKFKDLNEAMGYEAGDAGLVEAANYIKMCLRESDTVCRWSGDEFVVILEDVTDEEAACRVAKKILLQFSSPLKICETECFVSLSIGVALFPAPACDSDTFLKHADIAMSQAKRWGGNAYQVYSHQTAVVSVDRLALKNGLRDALNGGGLFLQYQPQVDIKTNRIVGVEALLRWHHPIYGRIDPSRFIPLAEESGLIVTIGDWVLKTACAQNKSWRDEGLPPVKTAVNLSVRQLMQPGIVQRVLKIIHETGLDPGCVDLEITEGLLIDNLDHSKLIFNDLRAAGINIAIDDFGTGYSSLNYLCELPVDTLKMDGSFVRRLLGGAPHGVKSFAIAEAIVSMAHRLDLMVVAEAVESEEQLADLRRMECDQLQGFLFSPPLDPEDIALLLARQRDSQVLFGGVDSVSVPA